MRTTTPPGWQQTLLKRRRTKIIATLGPASDEPAVIERLIGAGVNVFRLNLSHGDHASHRAAYERVRAAADKLGEPVAVLGDLCGPKIRVGQFAGGKVVLEEGSRVTVTTRDVIGGPGLIPSQYEALADDVYPGDHILLDDGLLELEVEDIQGTEVGCRVVQGGVLKDRKGMNLPGVNLSTPSLTAKDKEDAYFLLDLGVDFLALSFVRRAADMEELRAMIKAVGRDTHIIAKIELPQALEAIEEILDVSDGIMVARGDLGVELPPETVPIAQRQLVARARAKAKPAIVATQMLESMIERARPTRAEVSDVSSAVFSGADAVMLSAETASGAYPVQAVEMMDRVARQVEGCLWTEGAFGAFADQREGPLPLSEAVARATAQLSRDLRVRTIVVFSRTGTTAGMMAAARPGAPLLAVTSDPATCRRMNLLWGVVPVLAGPGDLDHPAATARRLAKEFGLAVEGQYLLTVAGFSTEPAENAPSVTVLAV
ncbi:MAG TPA: pyruvate kinase [Gemmataceae bacterium]|nr:pyruvate kinase [Gemmataceae bacterium]